MKSATSIAFAQVGKFLTSGGISTVLHWALMALLIGAGIHATIATLIGALAGAALNYLLQYHWTFSVHKPHAETISTYVLAVLLSAGVNTALFHFIALHLGETIVSAQITATTIVAGMNFIVYKRVVFHERNA